MKITIQGYEAPRQIEAKLVKGADEPEKEILRKLEAHRIILASHPGYQRAKGTVTITEVGSGLAIFHGENEASARAGALRRVTTSFDSIDGFIEEVKKQTEEVRFNQWLRTTGNSVFQRVFGVPLTWCCDLWWAQLTGRLAIDPEKVERMLYHQRGENRGEKPTLAENEEASLADRVEHRFGKFARNFLETILSGKIPEDFREEIEMPKAA